MVDGTNKHANRSAATRRKFIRTAQLDKLITSALAHLSREEARQRLFLAVSITFHGIADICRAFSADTTASEARRNGMLDQVAGAIAALLSAPARS